MYVGVTANKVQTLPTYISAVAEAVFFDICGLAEKIPDCAFGRVMSASLDRLRSTPAASASGGQAAPASLWRAASGGQQQQQHKTDT